jgi:hypothetical protein
MPKKSKSNFKVVARNKDATILKTESGKKIKLETPTGKFKRYGREIKKGCDKNGERLTQSQISYRAGYRSALGEQARIYKKTNK